MEDLLTTKEAAELLNISDGRVRQLIIAKILPAQKFGKANVIKREDLKLLEDRVSHRPKKEKAA